MKRTCEVSRQESWLSASRGAAFEPRRAAVGSPALLDSPTFSKSRLRWIPSLVWCDEDARHGLDSEEDVSLDSPRAAESHRRGPRGERLYRL